MPNSGNARALDLLRREPEAEPAFTLVLLDVLFCDNEQDPQILDRYLSRFEHTLASLQAQEVPEDAELLVTIQISADKRPWIDRLMELLRTPPANNRARIRVFEYEHPVTGYEGGDPERLDWVKKPNLHSPYREQMFRDTHRDLRVDRYRRVIRVGLDDDDIWMPWQTATICAIASAARLDPLVEHDGVLALGMVDTLVGYAGENGIDVDSAQLKRSLTGEKFHVIDDPDSVESIAAYSPTAVPERIDVEFHERFARRGIGLYAAGGYIPGFVYMRWGQNLSRQGKEYLETKRFGRVHVDGPADVARIAQEDVPRDGLRLWFGVPGAAVPLKVSARRLGNDVKVESNLAFQQGKNLKIAYYLMRGAERLETRWYSADHEAEFKDVPAGVSVRAYLRAADGTTTRAESEKV